MTTTHATRTPTPESAGSFATPPLAADPRHLLGLEGLTREQLTALLDEAVIERDRLRAGGPDRADLAGCMIMLAFIEDSTRTRTSFDIAARRLGAQTIAFSASASSLNKGESVLDTMRLFEAMGAQLLVVRHFVSGAAAHLAARHRGRDGCRAAPEGSPARRRARRRGSRGAARRSRPPTARTRAPPPG